MTEKLYYKDSYLFEFDAVLTDIVQLNGRCAAVLSATAFFPTGGGQSCDTGTINTTFVEEVFEENGVIYHFFDGEPSFSVGDVVFCKIDGAVRFARMQAHSGEHIVSGVAHNLFGVENVGFHMDGCLMTVDFDKPLSKEDIALTEEKANDAVYKNLPVYASVYSRDELVGLEYRSKKEFDRDIRIVTVEGIDRCACCAPHVKNTGEIGLIKILSGISHRGGVRITLICGKTAYEDYRDKYTQTLNIAALLAAKHSDTDSAVELLLSQVKELKYAVCEQKRRLCSYIVENTCVDSGRSVVFVNDCDMDDLSEIALGLSEKCGGLAVACSGSDAAGYTYSIMSKNAEICNSAKQINAALNGRGGGRDFMIRGRFNVTKEDIVKFFDEFEVNS